MDCMCVTGGFSQSQSLKCEVIVLLESITLFFAKFTGKLIMEIYKTEGRGKLIRQAPKPRQTWWIRQIGR